VLFPTPPFPDSTSILCFIERSLSAIASIAGLTLTSPDAHCDWLGQPWHADCLPASWEAGPGQWAFAFSGI
jgi:hypothetical protein